MNNNWFKKVFSTREPSIDEELNPKDKFLYDNITEFAKQIGIKDNMPLNQACWLILIEVKRSEIDLKDRIKLLEDNAFSDRAKRIELENKVEELTNKIIRLDCK